MLVPERSERPDVFAIGLAEQDACTQEGDLAALGGDLWRAGCQCMVQPVADILHGVFRAVCLSRRRHLGHCALSVRETKLIIPLDTHV